jgi:hypothetical protein
MIKTTSSSSCETLILNELCEGGTLLKILEGKAYKMPEKEIINVMKEIV